MYIRTASPKRKHSKTWLKTHLWQGSEIFVKKKHRYDKHSCASFSNIPIYEILSSKTNIKLPNTAMGFPHYSSLCNKRVGWNKYAGWEIWEF